MRFVPYFIILSCLITLGCNSTPVGLASYNTSIEDSITEAEACVLNTTIVQVMNNTSGSRGSGVIIDENYALTAYHVIADSTDITVERISATSIWGKKAKLVYGDPKLDLALLKADFTGRGISSISHSPIRQYQKCVMIGHQKGLATPVLTEGRVDEYNTNQYIRVTTIGYFGSSGCGIFVRGESNRWELAAIAQRILVDEQRRQVLSWVIWGSSQKSLFKFMRDAGEYEATH